MATPLPPEQAWRRIAERLKPLPEESVERRRAGGRVLTQSLLSRVDVPPSDVSAMDGYAVSGEVALGVPREVAGTIAAGSPPGFDLRPPAVARIMTGAPVPEAADRVIPVEKTERLERPEPLGRETERVVFRGDVAPGEHIRRHGEILRVGDLALPAGALLTPGALSLVATHGYAEVAVHRLPTLALLATGDEVVPPESEPAPGQLRDSHTDFLLAATRLQGIRGEPLGIAPDRVEALRPLIARGLERDVLLLSGGVSMGEFDLVEGVLEDLGCEVIFDGVAIQPGKPLVFATHPGGIVFGLPGNPASVMVNFWLFVRPALRILSGHRDSWWGSALKAELAAPLPGSAARDRFIPAEVASREGGLVATPFPPKGSHDLDAYARGNGLVRIEAGSLPRGVGEACEVLPFGGPA